MTPGMRPSAIRSGIAPYSCRSSPLNTNARSEGYFRLEWRLAVERSHLIADDQAFLLPVTIDDTPKSSARVPDRFRERQWTRLEGGATTPAFVEQVKRLLLGAVTPATKAVLPHPMVGARLGKRRWLLAGALLSAATVAVIIAVALRNGRVPDRAPAKVVAAIAPAQDLKSLAVLPFENLSGRAEDAYLADGLQEEILNALARVRDLKVISRTSVLSFRGNPPSVREIGERLGVTSILEGSIRLDGNTVAAHCAADRRAQRPSPAGCKLRPRPRACTRPAKCRGATGRRSARGHA